MSQTALHTILLYGYCELDESALLRRFTEKGASSLAGLGGEYTIVVQGSNECHIVTSPHGVCQYYYAVANGRIHHADTVLDVLRKSGLDWSWNWRALADLGYLEHTLDTDTFHSEVHRAPAGSVISFRDGKLDIQTSSWKQQHPPGPADPEACVESVNSAIKRWMSDNPVVSLSGGFDSRLILSSFLKEGIKPLAVTMGSEDCTDVVISRQIADSFGLDLRVVSLTAQDYLDNGLTISLLTNGTKTGHNWHTYIYPKKAHLNPRCTFFVGSNGEFARSYYLDKGILSVTADAVAPQTALRRFWMLKLKPQFNDSELEGLNPQWRAQYDSDHLAERVERVASHCQPAMLGGLDLFYLRQRVRCFIANGLKLYEAHTRWRAPFLDPDWVTQAWRLPRKWKLGSNWHRLALARNCPKLLDFPEEGRGLQMAKQAPPLYWLLGRHRHPIVEYSHFPQWCRQGPLSDFLFDNVGLLEEIMNPQTARAILEEHRQTGSRTRTMSFLTALMFWKLSRKQAATKPAST